jgi:tetratricopeptide (TPR) repeat protein
MGTLIAVWQLELEIPIASCGEMTISRAALKRGFEPDHCYYVQHEPQMWDKTKINFKAVLPGRLAFFRPGCLMASVETKYPNDATWGACSIEGERGADAALLAGQKVYLIGRFLAMTQADAAEVVRAHGGVVVHSPAEDTSLVVVGGDGWPCLRDGSPTPAAERVQELRRGDARMAVLAEEEFFARLGLVEAQRSICHELTVAELSRVLGLRAAQVRRWARLGLVTPRRTVHRLAFFDLVQVASAKRICGLLGRGASLANIRRGLEQIERWLPQRDAPFSQLALLEHDGRIIVRLDGTLAEPSGQMRFNFDPPGELAAVSNVREDSESLFDQALAAEDGQDLAAAAELYGRALQHDPGDPVLHFNLGNVLFGLARYGDAAGSYQQALRLDSGYAEAWNNAGNTYAQLESWSAALAAFRRALELVPDYDDALYNLERVKRRMPVKWLGARD